MKNLSNYRENLLRQDSYVGVRLTTKARCEQRTRTEDWGPGLAPGKSFRDHVRSFAGKRPFSE